MTQAVRQYEQAVNDHCTVLGIMGDTTEARVSRLWDALTKGREAQARYNQLAGQIEEAKNDLTGIQESYHPGGSGAGSAEPPGKTGYS